MNSLLFCLIIVFTFVGSISYYVNNELNNVCSSDHLLILNKFQQTTVTEQYVINLHNDYLNELLIRYQAQPQDHDEWTRSQFIISLLSKYTLYVDGALLWSVIPTAPCNKTKFAIYESNVLNVIENVYEYLINHTIDIDIVSVLIILKSFMLRQLFNDCLLWIKENCDIPRNQMRFMSFIDFYKPTW